MLQHTEQPSRFSSCCNLLLYQLLRHDLQKGNSAEESEQEYLLQLRLLQLPMHLRTLQACLCGLNFLLIVRLKNCVPYNRMDKPLHSTRYRKWRSMPSALPGLHSPVSGITRQLPLQPVVLRAAYMVLPFPVKFLCYPSNVRLQGFR